MIKLPKIEDPRGNLSFIEAGPRGVCPFEIQQVEWRYDVPSGTSFKSRVRKGAEEMYVAMSGSFDIVASSDPLRFTLNRSDRAIVAGAGDEVVIDNFSTNSVLLKLSSETDEDIIAGEELVEDPATSHRDSDIEDVRMVDLWRVQIQKSSYTAIYNDCLAIPFKVRRAFYLYDVPADAERGGHSHYMAQELIVALTGSFDVVLDDGKHAPRRYSLNRPYRGLYIPAGMWRTLDNFSGGAVCLVLTSERYSEADYVREYDEFKRLTANA